MWYEIPCQNVDSNVSEPVEFEDDQLSDISESSSQEFPSAPAPRHVPSPAAGVKKRDFALPAVPLGKLIRDCATARRPPYTHTRDRRRERSVSRARDFLVASKRRTVGLPPANFRLPADDSKFRVPNMMPLPSRYAGRHRDHGGTQPRPLMAQSVQGRGFDVMSTNASWIQQNIKVSSTTL